MNKIITMSLYVIGSLALEATEMTSTLEINKNSSTPDIALNGHGVISAEANIYMNINSVEGSATRSFRVGKDANNNTATALFVVESDAVVKIGDNDIILNKGKGKTVDGADIFFKKAALIVSEDSLYINIDSDNGGGGQFKIGRGSEKNGNQQALFQIKEKGVPASETANGGALDTKKTEIRLYGNNDARESSANIFYYTGNDDSVNSNNISGHREELSIMAGTDIVGDGNDSSGVHYYGNNDSQHSGSIGMFTNGKTRFSIDKFGRVGVGSQNLLNDFYNHYKGRFNIIKPIDEPALYIEGADSTEGDITWKDGEYLQLGTWSANDSKVSHLENIKGTFNELMRITDKGVVEIGDSNTTSTHVGYLKLDTIAGTTEPLGTDCNSPSKYGRMIVNPYDERLWVCVASGWKKSVLN